MEFSPKENIFLQFDTHLKNFISRYFPEEQILPDSDVYVSLFLDISLE